ncbi:MAG: hypothetical protein K1W24_01250 [Lachnospiraceae bacterium]
MYNEDNGRRWYFGYNNEDTSETLVKKGKMTLEEIAECVPLLSPGELKKLEAKVMQMA